MQDIGVDAYGIEIMLPKATHYLIRINSVSNIAANILKQEMLSLGADAAVSRDSLTGKKNVTDCLLIGNLSQFMRLSDKLIRQPFGLDRLAKNLSYILENYQNDKFALDLGKYKLNLRARALLMGIVNLTPDSFSGDGLYQVTRSPGHQVTRIINFVEQMVRDGADIIDIGGESSRPQAKPVQEKEELRRTIPVIKALAKKIRMPISVDTSKPEVARQALDNGALIINDITALSNPKMARLVARQEAAVVLMHMQGHPHSMQKNPQYTSLIDEIIEYLHKAIIRAESAGIDKEKIIIDPGIGFGKLPEHNLKILRRLEEFKVLGKPIMVGPSRKSFIGKILNAGPKERIFGTVSSCILAVKNGAKIVRVHDIKEVKQALKVFQSIENA
jgi:dihydropteroate synthase